jgi:hypothetical protein
VHNLDNSNPLTTSGWNPPVRRELASETLSLFPLMELPGCDLNIDDVRVWHKKGWLSYDVEAEINTHSVYYDEANFVRDLVQSGLPDDQITLLLSRLERPYAYNRDRIAYSFKYGWVEN